MKNPSEKLQPRWGVFVLKRKAERLSFTVTGRRARKLLRREPPEPPEPMTWEDFIREMAARIVDKIEPLASLVGIIGILFTMVFGWRKDRREMEESKLRIRQLERQLSESRDRKPPS